MMSLVLDVVLAAMLGAMCFYCFSLNRRLRAIRDGQSELQSAIGVFDGSVTRAQRLLEALDASGLDQQRDLEAKTIRAQAVLTELSVMVTAGDNIAGRIEQAMAEVRAAKMRKSAGVQALDRRCA